MDAGGSSPRLGSAGRDASWPASVESPAGAWAPTLPGQASLGESPGFGGGSSTDGSVLQDWIREGWASAHKGEARAGSAGSVRSPSRVDAPPRRSSAPDAADVVASPARVPFGGTSPRSPDDAVARVWGQPAADATMQPGDGDEDGEDDQQHPLFFNNNRVMMAEPQPEDGAGDQSRPGGAEIDESDDADTDGTGAGGDGEDGEGGEAGEDGEGSPNNKADGAQSDDLQASRRSFASAELEERGLDRRHSFLRKRLSSKALSYQESAEEVLNLDYSPIIARKPVDVREPLRVVRMGREVKVMIVITQYNEDGDELDRTLKGIAAELDNLREIGVKEDEVLVLFVQDGREAMNPHMEAYVRDRLRLWDRTMLLAEHKGVPVSCHLFERSVYLIKHASQREYYRPLQMVFACKERNGGKLNSHLWAFSAYARQVQPRYLFLFDVGTVPQPFSLMRMVSEMDENPQIAGVCGEISVRSPRLYNLVEASQMFEYKISHILDKAMESVFGFVSVLPGAFSGYRWAALRGEPLNRYFLLEEVSFKDISPAVANMFLAEDRVLCYELVAKRRRNYTLHYVHDAVAETDIPSTLVALIKQRRRWLNGSFFALVYTLLGFPRLLRRSEHTVCRRLALSVQFIFNIGNALIAWFGIGSLFLSLFLIYSLAFAQVGLNAGRSIMWAFSTAYFIITIAQVLMALGNRPEEVARIYYTCSIGYGVIMYTSMLLSIWHLSTGNLSLIVFFAAIGTFATYLFAGLIHGSPLTIIASFAQYMFFLPTYVTTFAIYSFSNLNDISWGTREGGLRAQAVDDFQVRSGAKDKKLFAAENDEQPNDTGGEEDEGDDDPDARIDVAEANSAAAMAAAAAAAGAMPFAVPGYVPTGSIMAMVDPATGMTYPAPAMMMMGGGGGMGAPAAPSSSSNSDEDDEEDEDDEDDEDEALNDQAIRAAAEAVAAKRREERVTARRKKWEKEKDELRLSFVSFRTRIMTLWIGMNWIYITAILNWNVIEFLAFGIAYMVFFSLSFRIIGSVWYIIEKYLRRLWDASCAKCCCIKMPWERHRVLRHKERYRANRKRGLRPDEQDVETEPGSDAHSQGSDEEQWTGADWGDNYAADDAMAPEAQQNVFSAEAMAAKDGEVRGAAPVDLLAAVTEADAATDELMGRIGALGDKQRPGAKAGSKGAGDSKAFAGGAGAEADDVDVMDLSEMVRQANAATNSTLDRINALSGRPSAVRSSLMTSNAPSSRLAAGGRATRGNSGSDGSLVSGVGGGRNSQEIVPGGAGEDLMDLSLMMSDASRATSQVLSRVDALSRAGNTSAASRAGLVPIAPSSKPKASSKPASKAISTTTASAAKALAAAPLLGGDHEEASSNSSKTLGVGDSPTSPPATGAPPAELEAVMSSPVGTSVVPFSAVAPAPQAAPAAVAASTAAGSSSPPITGLSAPGSQWAGIGAPAVDARRSSAPPPQLVVTSSVLSGNSSRPATSADHPLAMVRG